MNDTAKTTKDVTVFSTTWCVYCKAAKQYLEQKGVPYKEVNVEEDIPAMMFIAEKTGSRGVPVIQVGSEFILGFDRQRLDHALTA